MNNTRRKELEAIKNRYSTLCETLRSIGNEFDDLRNALEQVKDEEQDGYDNMPDSLKDGEKGDKVQDAITAMEDAIAMLEAVTECAESNDETEFYTAIDTAKE